MRDGGGVQREAQPVPGGDAVHADPPVDVGVLVGLGLPWWVGLALTAVAFGYEHAIVKPDDLSRVNRAFFTANGFVGIALFVFALLDLVIRLGLRP